MRGLGWRRIGLVGLVVLGTVWGAVSWVEASREIDALCAMMTPGTSVDRVVAQLETGLYLRYRTEGRSEDATLEEGSRISFDSTSSGSTSSGRISSGSISSGSISFDSIYNAWTTSCRVEVASGAVVSTVYTGRTWIDE